MSWTSKSNTYEGRYLQLTITETVEPTNNRSKLSWTLSSIGGSSTYYSVSATSIVIDGVEVYSKEKTSWSDKVFPAAKGSTSGTTYVKHNTNGKKTIDIVFITSVYVGSPLDYGEEGIALTDIDRTAPTITCSVSNITSAGFKISATSNVTADIWDYSTDDGTTWTQFSTTAGTSASTTISSLSPNTTYKVKVRARKKSNYVYGTSSAVSAKTLGASVLVKTYGFAADVSAPVCKFNLTVYDAGYYHKLTIKKKSDDTEIFSANLGKFAAGTADRSYSLTSANRTSLLAVFPEAVSCELKLVITTYSDSGYSTIIGSASSLAVTTTTSAAVSAPTFTDFTYQDYNGVTTAVTGDDQVLVKSLSTLKVVCSAGEAKNGASIKGYSASVGNASKTATSTTIYVGRIKTPGSLKLTVTCTDSRGYSATVEKTVVVLDYEKPRLSSFTLRRKDEIEGMIQLSFAGSISEVMADGSTDTNALEIVRLCYKKTTAETYSLYTDILDQVSVNGTTFSFASLELLELDAESSYNFLLQIQDKFGTTTSLDVEEILPQGTPIVALRKRNATYDFPRVGINNPKPKYPLDVAGQIAMNGFLVLGYAGELTTENFDSIASGIYYYAGSGCYNAPVDAAGFLEAFTNGTAIIQRYTTLTGTVYNRGYNGSEWTAWV